MDEPVLSAVGDWLVENRNTIAAHAMPVASGPHVAAANEIATLIERLDVLASQVAAGELDPTDYAAATRHIRARLADAQRRAAVIAGRPATVKLLIASGIGAEWDRLCSADEVEPLRAVLREVLDRVVVRPATASRPTLHDIDIVWAHWATEALPDICALVAEKRWGICSAVKCVPIGTAIGGAMVTQLSTDLLHALSADSIKALVSLGKALARAFGVVISQ